MILTYRSQRASWFSSISVRMSQMRANRPMGKDPAILKTVKINMCEQVCTSMYICIYGHETVSTNLFIFILYCEQNIDFFSVFIVKLLNCDI